MNSILNMGQLDPNTSRTRNSSAGSYMRSVCIPEGTPHSPGSHTSASVTETMSELLMSVNEVSPISLFSSLDTETENIERSFRPREDRLTFLVDFEIQDDGLVLQSKRVAAKRVEQSKLSRSARTTHFIRNCSSLTLGSSNAS